MKANELKFSDIDRLIVDDVDQSEFWVHRDVFRDPAVFELEMKYIFERNWVFVGLDSQAPEPNDYFTTWVGRQPIIVARDQQGQLGAFINSCAHKGARIAHHRNGNTKQWVCSYHGWAYDTAGKNIYIKDQDTGCYAEPFNRLDHNLKAIKFGTYRGFLFASLSHEVPTLEDHLGDAKKMLDLVWDQGADGIEAIPGVSSYTYNGNWKMQIENCIDAYHLTSCHPSFMNIVSRRKAGESRNTQVKSIDFNVMGDMKGGTSCFPRGHAVIYSTNPLEDERGLFHHKAELVARCGETKTKWMLATRNLTIYPNVQFAENASLQMRIIRPLSVDKTEMTIYCLGAKGESDAAREIRIRQYEDFFNSSGLATPDDTIAYEDCQFGYRAKAMEWTQGTARGLAGYHRGGDEVAHELGIEPDSAFQGVMGAWDETVMFGGYRAWKQFIKDGLEADGLL
jgi:benzoate/toluate 1,2-dioxygenase subunit alpha